MKENFKADALIFDIDGVLLDVTRSFPEVIREAVERGWTHFCGGERDCAGYGPELEWVMKRHGGFNDDFDLAWTLLSIAASSGEKKLSCALPSPERLALKLRDFREPLVDWVHEKYGSVVPRDETRAMCAKLYGDPETGLYRLEEPMLVRRWDKLGLPVAIYSGRNSYEWQLAKKRLGWEDFPDEFIIESDSGIVKPSPLGLEILCERLGASSPVFFGDTASDMKAHAAFGRGLFAAVGRLLPEAEHKFETTEEAVAAFAPLG